MRQKVIIALLGLALTFSFGCASNVGAKIAGLDLKTTVAVAQEKAADFGIGVSFDGKEMGCSVANAFGLGAVSKTVDVICGDPTSGDDGASE